LIGRTAGRVLSRRVREPRFRVRRRDLAARAFTANATDCLWVADITYVRTFAGWGYAAFVNDFFSSRFVGRLLFTSLRTDLALDALESGVPANLRHPQPVKAESVHHNLA
jgi:putative transposase